MNISLNQPIRTVDVFADSIVLDRQPLVGNARPFSQSNACTRRTKPVTSAVPPPVAIGGLGGSGTRVFAAGLQHGGYAFGPTLNGALDNLWFTVLFKRAIWARDVPDPADIAISADLFCRAMTTGLAGNLTPSERRLLDELSKDLLPDGPWRCGAQAPDVASLVTSCRQPGGQNQSWGWKEPNTHLFLPQLDQRLNGFRYIHVLRNGLDMAFSGNTWQTDHWAHHYGVNGDPGTATPVRQLRYWVAANRRALDYGRRHMPGRFLVMDYDDFCKQPDLHWPRLQQFLGNPVNTPIPNGLIAPSTIGRSAQQDLSIFPKDVLDAARTLQFEVEQLTKIN